ncbi:hypothetical protein Q4S45_03330 [Massilia sp. R2A-15]|nr:hypothetical protein [Massilia sp. R2A-15]WLI90169.1 hypothetical protein Q4S45_03330 [Massilia sp. R2A-15]
MPDLASALFKWRMGSSLRWNDIHLGPAAFRTAFLMKTDHKV